MPFPLIQMLWCEETSSFGCSGPFQGQSAEDLIDSHPSLRKTIPVMLSSCLTTLHHDFESYKNYNCWGAARFSPSYLHPALFPPRPSICAAFSSVAWYRGWADPLSWHTVGRNWGRGSWGIRQWWLPAQQNYLRAGFWNKIEVLFIPDWASCEKLWMRDMKSLRFTKFVHPTTITTMARKSMQVTLLTYVSTVGLNLL